MFKLPGFEVKGEAFVVLSRDEYERLVAGFAGPDLQEDDEGNVEATAFGRASIGRTLKEYREAAGLSQAALAAKLRKSQTIVSMAERGAVSVGVRYIRAVEKAAGPAAVAKVEAARKVAARKAPAKAREATTAKKRSKAA